MNRFFDHDAMERESPLRTVNVYASGWGSLTHAFEFEMRGNEDNQPPRRGLGYFKLQGRNAQFVPRLVHMTFAA